LTALMLSDVQKSKMGNKNVRFVFSHIIFFSLISQFVGIFSGNIL